MSDVHLLLLKLKAKIDHDAYLQAIKDARRRGARNIGRVKILVGRRRAAFDRFDRVWRIERGENAEWIAWRPAEADSPYQPIIVTKSKRALRNELQRVAWDLTARRQLRKYPNPV